MQCFAKCSMLLPNEGGAGTEGVEREVGKAALKDSPLCKIAILTPCGSAADTWESGCAFTHVIIYNRFGAMVVWGGVVL